MARVPRFDADDLGCSLGLLEGARSARGVGRSVMIVAETGGSWDVFLAYAGADRDRARALSEALVRSGLKVCFDQDVLGPGDDWHVLLPRYLRASAVVVALVSSNTDEAHFERAELLVAIGMVRREGRRLVPVRLDRDVELPYGTEQLHAIDMFGPNAVDAAAKRITGLFPGGLGAVQPLPPTRQVVSDRVPVDVPDLGPQAEELGFLTMYTGAARPGSRDLGGTERAVIEQLRYAFKAMRVHRYATALHHLRDAREKDPLNWLSSYCLAWLLTMAEHRPWSSEGLAAARDALDGAAESASVADDTGLDDAILVERRVRASRLLVARAALEAGAHGEARQHVDVLLGERPESTPGLVVGLRLAAVEDDRSRLETYAVRLLQTAPEALQDVLASEELAAVRSEVERGLVTKLGEVVPNLRGPDAQVSPLDDAVDALRREFRQHLATGETTLDRIHHRLSDLARKVSHISTEPVSLATIDLIEELAAQEQARLDQLVVDIDQLDRHIEAAEDDFDRLQGAIRAQIEEFHARHDDLVHRRTVRQARVDSLDSTRSRLNDDPDSVLPFVVLVAVLLAVIAGILIAARTSLPVLIGVLLFIGPVVAGRFVDGEGRVALFCAELTVRVLERLQSRHRLAADRIQLRMDEVEARWSYLVDRWSRVEGDRLEHLDNIARKRDLASLYEAAAHRLAQLDLLSADERHEEVPLTTATMRSHVESLCCQKDAFAPWAALIDVCVVSHAGSSPGDLIVLDRIHGPLVRFVDRVDGRSIVSDCAVYGGATNWKRYLDLESYILGIYDL